MNIVPVIDLADGTVVHARAGRRTDYRPLAAGFAGSSDPEAVLAALSALYRFDRVYVADIDAIEGRGDHAGTLERLAQRFPRLAFWLDAGPATLEIAAAFQAMRPVIGSENHDRAGLIAALGNRPDSILSLDYRNGAFLGDNALLDDADSWPEDIIVMTLDRVGVAAGPDGERIRALQQQAPDRRFYAAGGVRDDADLERLQAMGVAGALVATALHAGTIRSCRRKRD